MKLKLTIYCLIFGGLLNQAYSQSTITNKSVVESMAALAMSVSCNWTGLLYGFLSLWNLEELLERFLSKRMITALSVLLLFVSSFGIYIGRYLRWNSWDILHHPTRLMGDIGDRIIHPLDHTRTWGVTIFMGFFLTMLYFTFRFLKQKQLK